MNGSFSELVGSLFLTNHYSVYDIEFQKHLQKAPWGEWLRQSHYFKVKQEYIDCLIDWIYSSRRNHLSDSLKPKRNHYKRRDIIIGTTQSFDEAYFRYSNRRLRVFRGEYGYHRRCFKNTVWLDDATGDFSEPLDKNDWVIVSLPFCGSGREHPLLKDLFEECLLKQAPLLIDCAWFGTCFDVSFDLSHPAITEVSFSLSKGIGLGYMRTGLRFSNYPESETMPIAQHNIRDHLVFSSCQIGIYQMEKFKPDWQVEKYHGWYQQLCQKYNMIQTKCLHVALLPSDHAFASHFLIDEIYSKVGVREALKAIRQKRLLL